MHAAAYRFFIATGLLVASLANAQGRDVLLADDGKANAVILVAPDAPAPVLHAAEELHTFLKQVTGADFQRVHTHDPSQRTIAVGPAAARMVDPAFNGDGLGDEGIVINMANDETVVLAGGAPRGTLYAVSTFLEDFAGCRWWAPQASDIPHRPTLTIPADTDVRYTPPLEYRYPFWSVAFDAEWLARNKANGHWNRGRNGASEAELVERYGGYMSHGGVHTFYRLIPPEKYFENHPEWFSLIDGKRKWEYAQLCLSNAELRAELIKNLKEHIRKNPTPPVYSVSQNDWFGYCTCEKCQALAERHGGQSGVMLDFVNEVADAVAEDFPDRTISTLAYQYTRKPPVGIRPRPNVVIQLCSIECSFAVPLTDDRNASFRDDIIGWSEVADRLYIWDYTGDFRHYLMPHPNLRVLGPNIRFFVEHNAKGIFEQGSYTTLGAEFGELRCWVMAKLLWDPSQDDQALLREFCDGYYGPAAPHVLAYIDTIHDAAADAQEYAHCLPTYDYQFPYLSFEVLSAAWNHLQQAEQVVVNDPERHGRVQSVQLGPLYAFLWKWNELKQQAEALDADWPLDSDINRVAAQVKHVATERGVTAVREWEEGFGLIDRSVKRAIEPSSD